MRRVVKIMLMWLLVLALPVQGLAAQRMLFCTPAQHAVVQVQAEHDHTAHMHAEHGQADATADAATTAQADASHGKCSACASCCAALGIVAAPLVFDLSPPSPDYSASVFAGHSGYTPSRLDRPPRSPLA
jgi:hypothetical protein